MKSKIYTSLNHFLKQFKSLNTVNNTSILKKAMIDIED